jgi:hypothetical protein
MVSLIRLDRVHVAVEGVCDLELCFAEALTKSSSAAEEIDNAKRPGRGGVRARHGRREANEASRQLADAAATSRIEAGTFALGSLAAA